MANSVTVPVGVTRPILLPLFSTNHKLPSGPAVMAYGPLEPVGMANSVIVPEGVIRAILFAPTSVNHTFPSGPVVTPRGKPKELGRLNSLMLPSANVLKVPVPIG